MFLSLRLKGRGLQGVNFRVLCTGLFIKITEQEKLSLNDGLRLANPKPLMQEFDDRNVEVLGMSINTDRVHKVQMRDLRGFGLRMCSAASGQMSELGGAVCSANFPSHRQNYPCIL